VRERESCIEVRGLGV
jgi:hypothetical protein